MGGFEFGVPLCDGTLTAIVTAIGKDDDLNLAAPVLVVRVLQYPSRQIITPTPFLLSHRR